MKYSALGFTLFLLCLGLPTRSVSCILHPLFLNLQGFQRVVSPFSPQDINFNIQQIGQASEGQNGVQSFRNHDFTDSINVNGYAQLEIAYRIVQPSELTKVKQILQIGLDHRFNEIAKVRITGRFFYDAIFDLKDNFPDTVRQDQETEAVFRETYLDLSLGDWNLTLGKQQIVWGEVLGFFFADVVTAKDFREFLLPSFEYIRIPPWAINLQYYVENNTIQIVWIPVLEFDKLGKPESEFAFKAPVPEGTPFIITNERKPANSIQNSEIGLRWSALLSGWNPVLFYLYTYDHLPTFSRTVEPGPVVVLTPEHTRIHQLGYTVSKDFNGLVLKSEGVASLRKKFSVQDLSLGKGVVVKDFVEYVIGGEFTPFAKTNINLQVYQRIILDHNPSLLEPAVDTGLSIWVNPRVISTSLNPELFFIYDFRNQDWMLRPKITWTLSNSWLLTIGSDLFGGNENGLFGQFSSRKRVYTQLTYNF